MGIFFRYDDLRALYPSDSELARASKKIFEVCISYVFTCSPLIDSFIYRLPWLKMGIVLCCNLIIDYMI